MPRRYGIWIGMEDLLQEFVSCHTFLHPCVSASRIYQSTDLGNDFAEQVIYAIIIQLKFVLDSLRSQKCGLLSTFLGYLYSEAQLTDPEFILVFSKN